MKLKVKEITLFSMLGAIMFLSKFMTEALPNIHLLGVFIVSFTVVYGVKALFPIYVFVFLEGIVSGFAVWWIPYLYIWTVLFLFTIFLPKAMPKKVKPFIYCTVCSLHGFLYGTLYAPAQALFFHLNFRATIAWIAAGLYFDAIHGVSNFIVGFLIIPIVKALESVNKFIYK